MKKSEKERIIREKEGRMRNKKREIGIRKKKVEVRKKKNYHGVWKCTKTQGVSVRLTYSTK